MKSYNGWKNWETWNVALWIGNDEGLYNLAKSYKSYRRFIEDGRFIGNFDFDKTPDDVDWLDPNLDYIRLDEMMEEL